MKDLSHDQPYTISTRVKGKKCIVTIKISADYTWERLCGELCASYDWMTSLHCAVGNLPICYFSPCRLKNPRVSSQQKTGWNITVNKDFLFIRDAYPEAGKTYQVVLDIDK